MLIPYYGIGYISHHGILGQRWGIMNGPPYPLGSDVSDGSKLVKKKRKISKLKRLSNKLKKRHAEREMQKRNNAINYGDANDVLKYVRTLTPEERASVMARLRDEEVIRGYADNLNGKRKTPMDRMEDASYNFERYANSVGRINKAIENSNKLRKLISGTDDQKKSDKTFNIYVDPEKLKKTVHKKVHKKDED